MLDNKVNLIYSWGKKTHHAYEISVIRVKQGKNKCTSFSYIIIFLFNKPLNK